MSKLANALATANKAPAPIRPVPVFAEPLPPARPAEQDELDIRLYGRILGRHKVLIGVTALIMGILGALVAFSMEPVYESKTTLIIGANQEVYGASDNPYGAITNRKFHETQLGLLESRALANETLTTIAFDNQSRFDPLQERASEEGFKVTDLIPEGMKDRIKAILGRSDETETVIAPGDSRYLPWLRDNLTINSYRDSQLVDVVFSSHDPDLSALVANTYAETYINRNLEGRQQSTEEASEWLTEQADRAQEALTAAESQLQTFREEAGLVNISGVQSIYAEQLKDINIRVTEARRRRAEAQTLFSQASVLRGLSASELESFPLVMQHPTLQSLKTEQSLAERNVSELSKRYGPKHPKMITAQADLDAIGRSTSLAVAQIVSGLENDLNVANANAAQLESELRRLESRVQDANRKEFQVEALEREVTSARGLYDSFANRLKKATIASDDDVSRIADIADRAVAAARPVSPDRPQLIGIALMGGLLIGMALAFLREHMDNTFSSRDEVEDRLRLPVLGALSVLDRKSRKDAHEAATAFLDDGRSAFAEGIRTVRTGLVLSTLDDPLKIIVVTSTVAGEGKTTIAMNLASAMGQSESVLLIDADLRRPSVGKLCNFHEDSPGLTDAVAGTAEISKCIKSVSGSVYVMPAGTEPSDPLEVLSTQRFNEILHQLSGMYDWIVIDSAPVQPVSDTVVLATKASAVLYVVKSKSTTYQAVSRGIRKLKQRGAPIAGVILNHMRLDKAERYGEYAYYPES